MVAKYSDNPKQFNIDYMDSLYEALRSQADANGVKKVRIGNYAVEYRSDAEIRAEIEKVREENLKLDGGLCTEFFRTRKVGGCR